MYSLCKQKEAELEKHFKACLQRLLPSKMWWTPESFYVCSTLYSLFVERLNRSGCMINAGPVAIPTKAAHSPLVLDS